MAFEALQGRVDALAQLVEENQKAVEEALADLEAEMEQAIEDIYKALDALETSLEKEIAAALADAEDYTDAAIKALYYVIQAYVDDEVAALTEKIEALDDKIDALDLDVTELWNYANQLDLALGQLQSTVAKLSQKIDALEAALADINQFFVLGDRLSSLVFAPSTYVDGIASIYFPSVTFTYNVWALNTSNGHYSRQSGTYYTVEIADEGHAEEYLYSPSHVNPNSVASLTFVSKTATNISTKADDTDDDSTAGDVSPLIISSYEFANGVLSVTVAPNEEFEFPTEADTFTTVALKAEIADDYKLDSEEGQDIFVFSDWARVYSASANDVEPEIHNTMAVDADGNLDENATDTPSHFYYLVAAIQGGTGAGESETNPDTYTFVATHSILEVDYDKSLDLNTLVTICDGAGTEYSVDEYPFVFEFNLRDHWCVNDMDDFNNGDETPVNQSAYAQIDENGVMTAYGTLKGYLDAVGKYPVVEVILRDTTQEGADGNYAIVDVRYFAINWVAEELDPVWFPIWGYDIPTITNSVPDKTLADATHKHASINYRALEDGVDGRNVNYTTVADLSGEEFLADIATIDASFKTAADFFEYYDENYYVAFCPYIATDADGNRADAATLDPTKKAVWESPDYWSIESGEWGDGRHVPGHGSLGWYTDHFSTATYKAGLSTGANVDAAGTRTDGSTFFALALDPEYIMTQHSQTDVTCEVCGSHGGLYLVIFTFKSLNASVTPDVIFYAFLHVYDDCTSRTLNPAYKLTDPENYNEGYPFYDLDETSEAVVVKGVVDQTSQSWSWTSDVTEHFTGGDILGSIVADSYGWYPDNVKDVQFDWTEEYWVDEKDATLGYWVTPDYGTGITTTSTSTTVGLATEIIDPYMVFGMDCNEVLKNGELCPYSYYIVYIRPFVAGEDSTITIRDALGVGGVTVSLGTAMTVYDNDNNLILSWGEIYDATTDTTTEGWVLSEIATSGYYITDSMVSVSYDFDTTNDVYKDLIAEVGADALTVNTADGTVTWNNGGTALMKTYTVPVTASVTFKGICIVENTIYVTLTPAN